MQETAFIWDLDGTLLDSYEAILLGIEGDLCTVFPSF